MDLIPRVIVLPDAWRTITKELDRAAEVGLRRTGSADEGVFVPLCGVVHRAGALRVPRIERTGLYDIEALVVAHALVLPSAWVEQSAVRIRFRSSGPASEMQERFDELLDAALARFGRLDVLARGHSHPFDTGRTRPSGPDRREHLAPCRAYNAGLGIDAGFTLIAVRACEGRGWALQGFASTESQEVIDLGLAEIAGEESPHHDLLKPPFLSTPAGVLFDGQLRRRHSDCVTTDALSLGWTRLRIDDTERSVWAVPPGFPDAQIRGWIQRRGIWTEAPDHALAVDEAVVEGHS